MKDALRLSAVVPSSPHTVYSAWLDSAQHAAFTGSKAVINGVVGGTMSAWDGYITGKFVQLDLGRRIVQSWRTQDFPKGAPDSRLEVHFEPVFDGTRILILHSEIPDGQGEKYRSGWNEFYFVPMKTYFGKMAIAADRASAARLAVLASQPRIFDEEEEAPRKPIPRRPLGNARPLTVLPGKGAKPPPEAEKAKPAKAEKARPAKAEKAKPPPKAEKARPAKAAPPPKKAPAKPKKAPAKPKKAPAKPKKAPAKPKKASKPKRH